MSHGTQIAYFRCGSCDHEWDSGSFADEDCPECGKPNSPYSYSEDQADNFDED